MERTIAVESGWLKSVRKLAPTLAALSRTVELKLGTVDVTRPKDLSAIVAGPPIAIRATLRRRSFGGAPLGRSPAARDLTLSIRLSKAELSFGSSPSPYTSEAAVSLSASSTPAVTGIAWLLQNSDRRVLSHWRVASPSLSRSRRIG